MILIVTEEDDTNIFKVCDWLIHFNKEYVILHEKTSFFIQSINLYQEETEIEFKIDNKLINLKIYTDARKLLSICCNYIKRTYF